MFWFIISIILFLITAYLFRRSMQFQKTGVKVNAVVEKVDVTHRKRRTRYYPIFKFEANGQTWSVKSAYGGGQWKDKEGVHYDIVYDPKNPMQIQLLDFNGVLFWTVFFCCMGAVCLTIAGWKFWYVSVYA